MTDRAPEYTIKLLPRGGSGRDARWAWEIRSEGSTIPLEKGTYSGLEAKAYSAAESAMKRLAAKRAARDAGKAPS